MSGPETSRQLARREPPSLGWSVERRRFACLMLVHFVCPSCSCLLSGILPSSSSQSNFASLVLAGALAGKQGSSIIHIVARCAIRGHEADYRFGKTRTWCPTGTALRVRKAGTVTVQDPKAGEKNT